MNAYPAKVFVHIVSFNNARTIAQAIRSVLAQRECGAPLKLLVTDNASTDETLSEVNQFAEQIEIVRNERNLGFCGAHNQGATEFLNGDYSHLLILNPDVQLHQLALRNLIEAGNKFDRVGMLSPKLLRADENLNPLSPATVDAAGMRLTRTLRHFDIGSGENDRGQFETEQNVFGGTGACLLLKLAAVQDLVLLDRSKDEALFEIYPQLRPGAESRVQLFDEAFFAYREDADLAWRAFRQGWQCRYVPNAIGYHQRVVLPERRAALAPEINSLGVRNRFLLQLNHYSFNDVTSIVLGAFIRNLIVIAGVLFRERTSLVALRQIWRFVSARLVHAQDAFTKKPYDLCLRSVQNSAMNYRTTKALITGASAGIGEEFARQLHARGAQVILVARRAERLRTVCDELNSARANSAFYRVADLAQLTAKGDVAGVTEICSEYVGTGINLLINNVGRGSFGRFEEISIADEIEMVVLNVIAPLRISSALIPEMKARGAGGIINISSIAGFQPLSYMATYGATKAFNLSHSLALRYELKKFGINVMAVCPGPVDTEFKGVSRVPGTLTGVPRDISSRVVAASLRAFERGGASVIPGWRSKLVAIPSLLLPKPLATWVTSRVLAKALLS